MSGRLTVVRTALLFSMVAVIVTAASPLPGHSAPPNLPLLSSPVNGLLTAPQSPTLQWTGSDPDGDVLHYDVYLGFLPDDAALVSSNQAPNSYAAGLLLPNKRYYWYVVARDPGGAERTSLTWTFVTENGPPPPDTTPVFPANGAVAQLTTLTLDWSAFDPNGDGVTYWFYLSTSNPPSLWTTLTATSKELTLNPDTQYYWKVMLQDQYGVFRHSAIWNFHTDVPHPTQLMSPSPVDISVDQSMNVVLDWHAFDPDGDPVHFDLYFGTTSTPAKVASFLDETTFDAAEHFAITPLTSYYWKVVARTANGSTTGPLWSFTTKANSAPSAAFGPTPANSGLAHNPPWLNWQSADVDAPEQRLKYDVYFGTTDPPPLVESGRHAPNYSPGTLQEGTPYYWSVTVSDPFVSTPGPVWSFMVSDSILSGVGDAPAVTTLGHNRPNPFNPQTIIPYGVPNSSGPVHVRLAIYDTLGRRVRVLVEQTQSGGSREAVWRGDDERGVRVSSGVYYCILEVGADRRTQKLVLLK